MFLFLCSVMNAQLNQVGRIENKRKTDENLIEDKLMANLRTFRIEKRRNKKEKSLKDS